MFNFSRPKTVDAAISGLLKAQRDLQIVSETRAAKAFELREAAALILKEAQQNDAEVLRADMVLDKLKAITEVITE